MNHKLSNRLLTRRRVISTGAAAIGASALMGAGQTQPTTRPRDENFDFEDDNVLRGNDPHPQDPLPPGEPGRDYTPVIVPNGWTLPYRVVDGVKVFHLVAEEVPDHEFVPPHEGFEGLYAHCWGYNGSVHGPVIEAVEGDRVRIFVTNRLAAPTTVHWHGILLPNGMDGVGGLSQRSIRQGETFMYEFTLRQHGTYMYHSHHDEMTQMGMGMVGMFVIHPRGTPPEDRPERDFALMLHEWAIEPGTRRPDPNEMTDFNVLTINGRAFPGTAPLIAKQGDRVRIRLGNLSAMDHHPIHLHGYYFKVTETDGGRIPDAGQWPETTVLVPVGATRTVEFVADNPGDWAMHCHMTHHVMNQMGHDMPNMIGMEPGDFDRRVRPLLPGYMTMGQHGMGDMGDMGMTMPPNSVPMQGSRGPYDYITMGGMFTILKVREQLPHGYDVDPGWYQDKPGEQALPATPEALAANGIAADGTTAPTRPANLHPNPPQAPPLDAAGGPTHHDGAHAPATHPAVVYVCPMHPDVTSTDPAARCPKCGMRLEKRGE